MRRQYFHDLFRQDPVLKHAPRQADGIDVPAPNSLCGLLPERRCQARVKCLGT